MASSYYVYAVNKLDRAREERITMVSYVDVCVFSRNLTTTQRLSRDIARDCTTFDEDVRNIVVLGSGARAPESIIPLYNGQYHIDFWLCKVDFCFLHFSVPEENKCAVVSTYFSHDVVIAYDTMQWSRIHRGEAIIEDWPTLKAILRCVFLPLMEQLQTTVVLNDHLPSPPPPVLSSSTQQPSPKKKTSTHQPPAVSELSRKVDSLSLSSCLCSFPCSNKKDVNEKKDIRSKTNRVTWSMLDDDFNDDFNFIYVPPLDPLSSISSSSTLHQEAQAKSSSQK